jgi:hypothetical protein
MVGRVPPGKTARAALYETKMAETLKCKLKPETVEYWRRAHREWVEMLGERGCIDFYARCHAKGEDLLTLTAEEFESFKAAGGGCAW